MFGQSSKSKLTCDELTCCETQPTRTSSFQLSCFWKSAINRSFAPVATGTQLNSTTPWTPQFPKVHQLLGARFPSYGHKVNLASFQDTVPYNEALLCSQWEGCISFQVQLLLVHKPFNGSLTISFKLDLWMTIRVIHWHEIIIFNLFSSCSNYLILFMCTHNTNCDKTQVYILWGVFWIVDNY